MDPLRQSLITVAAGRFCALAGLVLVCNGCVLLPIPLGEGAVTDGTEPLSEQIARIEPGVTTRAEVIARLGEPSLMWPDERIFAYHWDRVRWALLYVIAAPMTGTAGAMDVPEHHLLVVQFDGADRVARLDRCERSPLTTYGEALRRWAAGGTCA